MSKILKKSLPVIVICGIFLVVGCVLAETGVITIPDPLGNKTLTQIIDSIINNAILPIAFGVALIMIIWGGIMYMTAGGSEDKVTKARKAIMWAMIGLAIVVAAKFIVQAIEAILKGI